MKPRFIRLTAEFNVRGGIYTTVVAEHRQAGWKPAPAVALPDDRRRELRPFRYLGASV